MIVVVLSLVFVSSVTMAQVNPFFVPTGASLQTYSQAVQACSRNTQYGRGAFIASLHSEDEYTNMNAVCEAFCDARSQADCSCWLGLTDQQSEGDWKNEDNTFRDYLIPDGQATTGENSWYQNQPNNDGNQDCAQLSYNAAETYGNQVHDVSCGGTGYPLCRKPTNNLRKCEVGFDYDPSSGDCSIPLQCAEGDVSIIGASGKNDIAGCGLDRNCEDLFASDSVEDCRQHCLETARCVAYVWAPYSGDVDYQGQTRCRLYHSWVPTGESESNQIFCRPSFYALQGDQVNYQGAVAGCAATGGVVASMHDAQDFADLKAICNAQCGDEEKCGCWVGIKQQQDEDDAWLWSNQDQTFADYLIAGGIAQSGVAWNSGQPDNGEEELCAILWEPQDFNANDVSCDRKSYPICRVINGETRKCAIGWESSLDNGECSVELACPTGSYQFLGEEGENGMTDDSTVLRTRTGLSSADDCNTLCQSNTDCTVFSWAPFSGDVDNQGLTTCTLFKEFTPDTVSESNQIVCATYCPYRFYNADVRDFDEFDMFGTGSHVVDQAAYVSSAVEERCLKITGIGDPDFEGEFTFGGYGRRKGYALYVRKREICGNTATINVMKRETGERGTTFEIMSTDNDVSTTYTCTTKLVTWQPQDCTKWYRVTSASETSVRIRSLAIAPCDGSFQAESGQSNSSSSDDSTGLVVTLVILAVLIVVLSVAGCIFVARRMKKDKFVSVGDEEKQEQEQEEEDEAATQITA